MTAPATVVASWPWRALVVAEARGADGDAVLARVGLRRDALTARSGRVPLDRHVALLDTLADDLGDPGFGLDVGARADPSDFGLVGLLGESSDLLGEALRAVKRYDALANDGSAMDVWVEGDRAFVREAHGRDGAPLPVVAAEATLAYYAATIRRLTGVERPLLEVRLAHARHPGWTPAREAIFGAPIRFDRGEHRLVLPAALLEAPLATARPGLARELAPVVDRLHGELPARGDLVDRARARLAGALRDGRGVEPLGALARALGVSPRSLQRALAARGLAYRALVDGARRDRARALLVRPELTLDAVAEGVGFADVRALRRACARWFGASPARLRRPGG